MEKHELEIDRQRPPNVIVLKRRTVALAVSAILLSFIVIALVFYFIPRPHKSIQCDELPTLQTIDEPRYNMPPMPPNLGNLTDAISYQPFFGRLPKSLIPEHYNIWMKVHMDQLDGDKVDTYEGKVSIIVRCDEETQTVKIHAWWLVVDFDSVVIRHQATAKRLAIRNVHADDTYQFVVINTRATLKSGSKYVVEMSYTGDLDQYNLCGFYPSPYEYGREIRWVALTCFQPDCARKAFPCFDEPQLKATFNISITHRPIRKALSNMPEIYNTASEDGQWNTTYFDMSVPMSTYHVSFALLDFPSLERKTSTGIQFRVWAEPNRIHAAEYSLDIGVKMLTFFEDRFKIKHPIPKMDMIAAPRFLSGGLENWALIVYQDDRMLYDPNQDQPVQKFDVATIVAHELAHMWFGNMVTIKWWNDLWLNEGFASFLEYTAIDFVHPDWKMADQFLALDLKIAMAEDESSDHLPKPMVREVGGWSGELWNMFDVRSYEKGASIIRSFRAFLDEDVIYNGLNDYLNAHLYDSVVTDDLWHALTESDKNHGGTNVKEMMDCWTLQSGLPVITVTRISDNTLKVEQTQFIKNRAGIWEQEIPKDQKWNVPLTYTHSGNVNFDKPARAWLLAKQEYVTIEIEGLTDEDWVIFNINQIGYYHVNYDSENWNKLAKQLKDDFRIIPARTRAALVNDAFVLTESGQLDPVLALQLTEYIHQETEYVVWVMIEYNFPFLRNNLLRTDEFQLFRNYWKDQLAPPYGLLGWNLTEPDLVDYKLRINAIKKSCSLGNDHCAETALSLYRQWMSDPLSDPIPGDILFKGTVCCVAIRQGGLEEWMFAYENIDELDVFSLIGELAMACTEDTWLLEGYLQIYDEKDMPFTPILYLKDKSATGFSVAWKFLDDRFEELLERFGERVFRHVLEFGPFLNSKTDLDKLLEFGSRYKNMSDGAIIEFHDTVDRVKDNMAWMDKNMAGMRKWLTKVTENKPSKDQTIRPGYADIGQISQESKKRSSRKGRKTRDIPESSERHFNKRLLHENKTVRLRPRTV